MAAETIQDIQERIATRSKKIESVSAKNTKITKQLRSLAAKRTEYREHVDRWSEANAKDYTKLMTLMGENDNGTSGLES